MRLKLVRRLGKATHRVPARASFRVDRTSEDGLGRLSCGVAEDFPFPSLVRHGEIPE